MMDGRIPLDSILTMQVYYDGPRLGIAEYGGVPYLYEAVFDHSGDDFGDTYYLSPVAGEMLDLMLEDWAIFCRWDGEFRQGKVSIETHPALPIERARYDEIQKLLQGRMHSDPQNRIKRKAQFITSEVGGNPCFKVKWIAV